MNTRLVNQLFLMALAAVTVFATGCSDDEENEDAVSPITEDAACKLMSISFDNSSVVTLEYNAKGYLSKAVQGPNHETIYIYDANNRLTKTEERENGDLSDYATFEYKDGMLTTAKYYEADGELEETETYKYDANKRLIEVTEDDGERTTYTYDSKGNVTKEEEYDNGQLDNRIVYENYDDKSTFMSAVKGLVGLTVAASKNNPGKETYTSFYNGQANPEYVRTYAYKYNSNGFPTEVTETDEDNSTEVTTYSYECK